MNDRGNDKCSPGISMQQLIDKIEHLEADNKVLIEALDDIRMNTLPERKASIETRMEVIGICAESALAKVRM